MVYAKENCLLEDREGRAYQRIFDANVADSFIVAELQKRVKNHKIAQFCSGVFPIPKTEGGDFVQGINQNGSQISFPRQYLNAHCLTVAGSGSGKTNKALFHSLQIILGIKGAWLFDCRKEEYRKIQPLLTHTGINLIILPIRDMRFNPLQVPHGVQPTDWIPRISDLLVMVLNAPPRASKLLESMLHSLFTEFKVFDGANEYPTLFDLFIAIRDNNKANPQARLALLDNLEPLLASLGPEVLAYRRGWSSFDLANYTINFVLSGVSETAQNLILNSLLLAEFTSRVARGISNPSLDLFISIDEGQRIVSNSSSYRNALTDLWPLVRGTGIGLDISVPTAHDLTPEALSFTATKYLGRCGSATDYESVGRSMGLTRQQLDWVFHNTRPGRFVTQLGEGNWRRPYVLDIPLISFEGTKKPETPRNNPLEGLLTMKTERA